MHNQLVYLWYVNIRVLLISLASLHCDLASQEVIGTLMGLLDSPDPHNAIHASCASTLFHFSCLHGMYVKMEKLKSRYGERSSHRIRNIGIYRQIDRKLSFTG